MTIRQTTANPEVQKAMAEGRAEERILLKAKMRENGFTDEQISLLLEK